LRHIIGANIITIRHEESEGHEEVRAINLAAFEGGPEADLVDTLRSSCPEHLSLVADDGDLVVGHILFTPVTVESSGDVFEGMGLAPMAVSPDRQRSGIGSLLVRRCDVMVGLPSATPLAEANLLPYCCSPSLRLVSGSRAGTFSRLHGLNARKRGTWEAVT
jgi:GNAT superfamily N-acetyltransferase